MVLMRVILCLSLKTPLKKVYNLNMFIGFVPLSFLISFLISSLLIYLDKRAAKSGDINIRESARTLHKKSISRFGGVAIYLSTFLTILATYYLGFEWNSINIIIFLGFCFPAFIIGLLDDLKIYMRPLLRLILLIPTPILFFIYGDIRVTNLDLGYFDDFLQMEILAIAFFCFATVGMMNAFNLIDGINGQLCSYLISIIIALKLMEYLTGNNLDLSPEFKYFTNIFLGSLIGFFILNLYGKIFLGDAGAYFLGSIVCVALIYAQQVNNFSPWSVMLILAYPFTDLIFSVIRRRYITGGDFMHPDAEHLHHVIYKRLKKLKFQDDRIRHLLVVVFLTILNFPYIMAAIYFANNTAALISIFIMYLFSYLLVYFSLSPRFLLRSEK